VVVGVGAPPKAKQKLCASGADEPSIHLWGRGKRRNEYEEDRNLKLRTRS